MISPRPGESELFNLVACLIVNGNSRFDLDLDRIAVGRSFSAADIADEFDRQQSINSLEACGECAK